MKRPGKMSEILQYGGHGMVIQCDGCGRHIDYVPVADERSMTEIKQGKLYATPESNLCWQCRKKSAGSGV